jgi:hypothetical protein
MYCEPLYARLLGEYDCDCGWAGRLLILSARGPLGKGREDPFEGGVLVLALGNGALVGGSAGGARQEVDDDDDDDAWVKLGGEGCDVWNERGWVGGVYERGKKLDDFGGEVLVISPSSCEGREDRP